MSEVPKMTKTICLKDVVFDPVAARDREFAFRKGALHALTNAVNLVRQANELEDAIHFIEAFTVAVLDAYHDGFHKEVTFRLNEIAARIKREDDAI